MKRNAKPKSTPIPSVLELIIPLCPKCKGDDIVQIDIIEGHTEIDGIDPKTGEINWTGYTDVCWDTQKSKHRIPHLYCRDCGFEGPKKRFIPKS